MNRVIGKFVESDIGLFVVQNGDEHVGGSLIREGNFNPEERARMMRHVTKESNVLIVGAHIGLHAIPMSRGCKKMHAVEADPRQLKFLLANVAMNNIDNMEVLAGAAGEKSEGTISFRQNIVSTGGSKRVPVNDRKIYNFDNPGHVDVPLVALDDIWGDVWFDYVHMDIEGSEHFAFLGAQKILAQTKAMSCEFIHHHVTDAAGLTAEQWVEPLRAHFNYLVVPGYKWNVVPTDLWTRGLQGLVDAEVQLEAIYFYKEMPDFLVPG